MRESINANLAGLQHGVAVSADDPGFSTEDGIDPMTYARVVRAISAVGLGADLSAGETLDCLAESLNREFLLTRTRILPETLADKKSALEIAGVVLRMIE